MEATSVLTAMLVAVTLEAILVGCFCILYPISLRILVYRHARNDGRPKSRFGTLWLFAILTVIFLLELIHFTLNLRQAMVAFADRNGIPGGAITIVSEDQYQTYVTNAALMTGVTFMGDTFMMYQVYVVWDRKWASVVLPTFFLFTATAAVVACTLEYRTTRLDIARGLFTGKAYALTTSYLVLTLLNNFTILGLFLGRLMWRDRKTRIYRTPGGAPSVHRTVLRTVVQSEALYSATIIATLVSYVAVSGGFIVTIYALPPVIGISFTLIVTHVGLRETMDERRNVHAAGDSTSSMHHSSPNCSTTTPPIALPGHAHDHNYEQEDAVGGKCSDST